MDHVTRSRLGLLLYVLLIAALMPACAGGDDDGDDDDGTPDDDDDGDDDSASDDDDDDVVPTTLDVTLVPEEADEGWELAQGPGELHETRNDLDVTPRHEPTGDPLSMTYFLTMSDLHQTDEESPTRLTFFDSSLLLGGAFSSAFRPQEDLGAHQLNAVVRTANRIQVDYSRSFDLAFSLGDNTDNGQMNEMELLIDILDGNGLLSGEPGYARPDSGDLDIDPVTGLNAGERNFETQETDGDGNNIDAFNREGMPNSNADLSAGGLRRPDGQPLPWFTAIGNHDVLNTGNFEPDSWLTFYSPDDYTADVAPFGFIPGLANTIEYWRANPSDPIFIDGGLFGADIDWRIVFSALDAIGLIPGDVSEDVDPRFDLLTLQAGTPEDGADDGVTVAPDPEREFMGHEGFIALVSGEGHGFADNNDDSVVNAADGGWYRVDFDQAAPGSPVPLRFLVLDSTDIPTLAEGGVSAEQLAWVQDELDQAVQDEVLVVALTHHPIDGILEGGAALEAMFLGCPNFILHLMGHGHANRIVSHGSEGDGHGYWEVETPSTIEFPEQARIVEITDNRDGTGSIYLTLFDHAALVGDDSDLLAGEGREEAFQDAVSRGITAGGITGGMGLPSDRNRILAFEIPEDIEAKTALIPSEEPVTSAEALGHRY